jgi:hypothetical protein
LKGAFLAGGGGKETNSPSTPANTIIPSSTSANKGDRHCQTGSGDFSKNESRSPCKSLPASNYCITEI